MDGHWRRTDEKELSLVANGARDGYMGHIEEGLRHGVSVAT